MNHPPPPTEIRQDSPTVVQSAGSQKTRNQPIQANPFSVLIADIQVIYQRDPAARSWLEVLFCYPGLQALWGYRLMHWLHNRGIPFLPRFLSQFNRWITGIEIHPGAQIGKGVFIDHGMGVVIGETAVVGDYTLIYQGVTLGGTGKEEGKRHPTLGKHVIVGTGAKILGNIQIGDHVRIGAGSVVLRNVPSHSTVVGVPGRITRRHGLRLDDLDHDDLRDLEAEVIQALFNRVKTLENQIEQLQTHCALSFDYEQQKTAAGTTQADDQMIREFLDGAGI